LVAKQGGDHRPVTRRRSATTLTIELARPGREFALGTIGLSIETSTLVRPAINSRRRSLVTLMRQLGPGVLRVGGNSLDYSWWSAAHEPAPDWAKTVVTPADLVRLGELLSAANWRVILGVDLGHFEPSRAASEARVAQSILGPRLLGIEIGNEPNGYATPSVHLRAPQYGVATYLHELSTYSEAIHAQAAAVALYGPDIAASDAATSGTWLSAVTSDAATPLQALTEHFYPTLYSVGGSGCAATATPSAADLLSPQVREKESELLSALMAAGATAHRPVRISETNTTASCDSAGAPETGPVFASALWSLDWSLRAAASGVEGLNFHGTLGSCSTNSFSPLCASNEGLRAGRVFPHPEYYGLLAARQLEGGHFVAVNIGGEDSSTIATYATVHPRGAVTLAIINFAAGKSAAVLLRLRGYKFASAERLVAPSLTATSDTTFGHAVVNSGGELHPTRRRIAMRGGAFDMTIPATSAAVITLRKR
jgi:hypothetical protein